MQTHLPDMHTQIADRRGTGGAVTASSAAATPVGACSASFNREEREKTHFGGGNRSMHVGRSGQQFWFQSPDIPVYPKKRDEMLAKYEKDTRAALISANKRQDEDDKVCTRFVPAHALPFTAILRLQRHRKELEELRMERQRLISQQKQHRPEKTASPIPDLDLKRLISSKVM